MNDYYKVLLISSVSIAISGCNTVAVKEKFGEIGNSISQTFEDIDWRKGGVLVGAVAGYAVCDDKKEKELCVAAGAAIGGLAGHFIEERQKRLEELKKSGAVKFEHGKVTTSNNKSGQENAVVVAVKEPKLFSAGASRPTESGKKKFIALAKTYTEKPQKILIVGHTDADGSSESNRKLSEKRAREVAKIFSDAGVPKENIYFQGAGESRPVASNMTREGKAKNRRVEIVEIDSEASLLAYNYDESTNSEYLNHSVRTKKEIATVSSQAARLTFEPKVDFGGMKSKEDIGTLYEMIGEPVNSGGTFSLFSKAYASDNTSGQFSCHLDAPRKAGGIKSLDGKELKDNHNYKSSDYLAGLNKSSWAAEVNGYLVGLTPVSILRKNGAAAHYPEVVVYGKGEEREKLNYHMKKTHVNTYNGSDGVLYRVYVNEKESPVQCFDIVFNKSNSRIADGNLVYKSSGGFESATYKAQRIIKQG